MLKIVNPNFKFDDERGSLVQLVRKGFNQFNIITSHANVTRGNHYHKINCEAFYIISGKLELTVTNNGITSCQTFSKGDFFSVEPFDLHSFYFIEDTILASMYDKGVELTDGSKDIFE